MSTVNLTPLGDGQFTDTGYTSQNNFGVEINFYVDVNTGLVGSQASIPNPPLVVEWPANWGEVVVPPLQVCAEGGLRAWGCPQLPWFPPPCLVDCGHHVPNGPPPTGAVPEPPSALLLMIPIGVILLCRHFKKVLAFL
jgi:hypothetical protein